MSLEAPAVVCTRCVCRGVNVFLLYDCWRMHQAYAQPLVIPRRLCEGRVWRSVASVKKFRQWKV